MVPVVVTVTATISGRCCCSSELMRRLSEQCWLPRKASFSGLCRTKTHSGQTESKKACPKETPNTGPTVVPGVAAFPMSLFRASASLHTPLRQAPRLLPTSPAPSLCGSLISSTYTPALWPLRLKLHVCTHLVTASHMRLFNFKPNLN